MVNFCNALLIAFCAVIISADANCGNGQQQIISGAQPDQVTVCCPGVMKAKNNNGYCCIGGTNDDCGKTTCFDDMSSCKALVNVHDSDYVKEIEDAAGVKPRRPGHPDDSDAADSGSGSNSSSSSSSSSGESSSAGTAAFTTTASTATDSPKSTSSDSVPATASNSQSPSSTVSNPIAATDAGAAGNNRPVLGLVGLAIVPAIMYGL